MNQNHWQWMSFCDLWMSFCDLNKLSKSPNAPLYCSDTEDYLESVLSQSTGAREFSREFDSHCLNKFQEKSLYLEAQSKCNSGKGINFFLLQQSWLWSLLSSLPYSLLTISTTSSPWHYMAEAGQPCWFDEVSVLFIDHTP